MATPVSVGQRVNYTPVANVALGAVVVQGDLVGVADRPIPANTLGALAVCGIFTFDKATGADTALTVGTKVYWLAASSVVTATAGSNKFVGKVTQAAGNSDATVEVMLIA